MSYIPRSCFNFKLQLGARVIDTRDRVSKVVLYSRIWIRNQLYACLCHIQVHRHLSVGTSTVLFWQSHVHMSTGEGME